MTWMSALSSRVRGRARQATTARARKATTARARARGRVSARAKARRGLAKARPQSVSVSSVGVWGT